MVCIGCRARFDPAEPWAFLRLLAFSFLEPDDVREALADMGHNPERLCAGCARRLYERVLESGAGLGLRGLAERVEAVRVAHAHSLATWVQAAADELLEALEEQRGHLGRVWLAGLSAAHGSARRRRGRENCFAGRRWCGWCGEVIC